MIVVGILAIAAAVVLAYLALRPQLDPVPAGSDHVLLLLGLAVVIGVVGLIIILRRGFAEDRRWKGPFER